MKQRLSGPDLTGRKLASLGLLLLVLLSLVLPQKLRAEQADVAVSIPALGYLARSLLGEGSTVRVLMPAGIGHETYEPGMKELKAVEQAQVIYILGLKKFAFESVFLSPVLQNRKKSKVVGLAGTSKVIAEDIHLWLDPSNMLQMARVLGADLKNRFPNLASDIAQREVKLSAELLALDSELKQLFSTQRRGVFLVYHPSWTYFAAAYGLEQLPIEKNGKEPGPRQLEQVIARAEKLGIRTIFSEPGISEQSLEYVAKKLAAEIKVIDPLSPDYINNLRQVARTIAVALS